MSPQTEGHPTIIAVRQFQSQIQANCMESDTRRTEEILNNLVPHMRYFVTHVFETTESHPIRDPDQFNIIVDSYFVLESHLARSSRADNKTSSIKYVWILGRPFDLLATTLFVLPVPFND